MKYDLYNEDPVIRTFTGKWMNVFEPTEDMICIEDIAHSLSMQCRFGGHLPKFYSVAQHSYHCSQMVDAPHKLAALLHDASESFICDIPRPIKHNLKEYKPIEDKLMNLIAKKYGFDYPLHEDIKKIDEEMLQFEWNTIMIDRQTSGYNFVLFSPEEAEKKFLQAFNRINVLFNSKDAV